jgi:hypothetical protein
MSYRIEVRSRGEELVYRDEDGEFHFDMGFDGKRTVVECSSYWNGKLGSAPTTLPPHKAELILARINEFFERRGEAVQVAHLTPDRALPSSYKPKD